MIRLPLRSVREDDSLAAIIHDFNDAANAGAFEVTIIDLGVDAIETILRSGAGDADD